MYRVLSLLQPGVEGPKPGICQPVHMSVCQVQFVDIIRVKEFVCFEIEHVFKFHDISQGLKVGRKHGIPDACLSFQRIKPCSVFSCQQDVQQAVVF